jgi:hypothetical protein
LRGAICVITALCAQEHYAIEKIIYRSLEEHHLYLIALQHKKTTRALRHQLKECLELRFEGDFDDFISFLDDMANKHLLIGSKLDIKSTSHSCIFSVELQQYVPCQERFPELFKRPREKPVR